MQDWMMGFSHIQGELCGTCVPTFFFYYYFKAFQRAVGLFLHTCSVQEQTSYYEACDNVYEDVENINKFVLAQNLRKRKGGLKSKNLFLIRF